MGYTKDKPNLAVLFFSSVLLVWLFSFLPLQTVGCTSHFALVPETVFFACRFLPSSVLR